MMMHFVMLLDTTYIPKETTGPVSKLSMNFSPFKRNMCLKLDNGSMILLAGMRKSDATEREK
jgi:hypothetical protein